MTRTTTVNRRRALLRAALWVLGAACTLATHAGQVVVSVHDQYGQAIRDQQVVLHPPLADPEDFWTAFRRGMRGTTDPRGQAIFRDVAPGQYTAFLRRSGIAELVLPADNPHQPIPAVTLVPGQEQVELAVELWRGTLVNMRVTLDDGTLEHAKALLHELDHSFTVEHGFGVEENSSRALVHGRWSVRLDPPEGYLLQEIEVDGVSIESDRALLDLQPQQSTVFVRWRLTSPALISGFVFFKGPRIPVEVVATLVEPGAWIGPALARGGSSYQIVRSGIAEDGSYELELPDGRWEVRVVGDLVESIEPPLTEVRLPERGHERADFTVTTQARNTTRLTVSVVTPNNESLPGATVEVWPMSPAERDEEPIAREESQSWGATLSGIPAGDLLVVAGHPQYVEGVHPVYDFDPESGPRHVTVRVRTAPRLQAFASDFDDEPVSGVRLALDRLDVGPDMLITDPELVRHARNPVAETDATGYAWVEGLWPGTYRVRGGLPGSRQRFVRLVDGDDLVEELDVTVDTGQQEFVELVVAPVAQLAGSLRCAAGRPLPSVVTAVAIPWSAERLEAHVEQLMEQAVLLQDITLSGSLRDTFLAGPLAPGEYFFGLKPRGFDRWSWALDVERHADAAPIQGALGEPTELGSLEIDCGPAIVVTPHSGDGVSLPDLRDVTPGTKILRVEGSVVDGDAEHDIDSAVVDVFPDRVVARGLPDGEARLELALTNGYFLPEPTITATLEAVLERGRSVVVDLPVPGVGGMLKLISDEGAAATLSAGDEFMRRVPRGTGGALFRSVPSGKYDVELCADPECVEILETWDGVEVHALETTEVVRGTPAP